jgi:hypothetical protein
MDRLNAKREVRESTMRLAARPERVLPLLCPVREVDWIETWSATLVHSDSGVAEKGCVFATDDPHGARSVWTVSRYDPAAPAIEFVIVTPGLLVTTLEVSLEPNGAGTLARWRRTFTALTRAGERAIGALAGPAYEARMERLERQLDHYLRTGEMLRS